MDKVLTIDRLTWRRGTKGEGPSRLLNLEGFKCCLGFDALGCGVPKEFIQGLSTPALVAQLVWQRDGIPAAVMNYVATRTERRRHVVYRHGENTCVIEQAITANDDLLMSEEQREYIIKKLLIQLGWDDVVFVN